MHRIVLATIVAIVGCSCSAGARPSVQPRRPAHEDREVLSATWKHIKQVEIAVQLEIIAQRRLWPPLGASFIDRTLVFDRSLALCQDPPKPGIACVHADEVGWGWPTDVLGGEAAREAFESFVARNSVEQATPKIEIEGAVMVSYQELVRTAQTRDCARGFTQFSLPGYSSQGHALVYATYNGGPLCGNARLSMLNRIDGVWQVSASTVLWFS